jgi:hypothetical protein
MLRRHIVGGSEIAELCRRIYQRHQRALDLIYEHRPDFQAELRELLAGLVTEAGLVLDPGGKRLVRFLPAAWEVAALKQGAGWTPSGRVLLFEFDNAPNRLQLKLWIGPGPQATRQWLFDRAMQHGAPLKPASANLRAKFGQIYGRGFLNAKDYEDDPDQTKAKVRDAWEAFRRHDLDTIVAALPVGELPDPGPAGAAGTGAG